MSTRMKGFDVDYMGYRFRSRLEARWAMFFEELEVPYQYESHGVELEEFEEGYLPDFFIDVKPCGMVAIAGELGSGKWNGERGSWVEVKSVTGPSFWEYAKAQSLVNLSGWPLLLLCGDPRVGNHEFLLPSGQQSLELSWVMCPFCREVGLVSSWEIPSEAYRQLRCCHGKRKASERQLELSLQAVKTAVNKARSARFGVWG